MIVTVAIVQIEVRERLSRPEREALAIKKALEALFTEERPRYVHRPNGAPYLEDRPDLFISVSHSQTHATVAVAESPIGIDIEQPRTQLLRVAPRFLNAREQELAGESPEKLLRAWTAKEAVFKGAGKEGIDFARDILLSDDMTTATFKDEKKFYLNVINDLPEDNLITIATLENPEQIIILPLYESHFQP